MDSICSLFGLKISVRREIPLLYFVFQAHKLVLALGSPVLSNMARSLPSDVQMLVQLPVDTQIPAIEAVLNFFYTGTITFSQDMFVMVLKLAELFKIQTLQDYCNNDQKPVQRKRGRPPKASFTGLRKGLDVKVKMEVDNVPPKRGRGRGMKPGFKPSRGRGSVSGTRQSTKNEVIVSVSENRGLPRKRGRPRGPNYGKSKSAKAPVIDDNDKFEDCVNSDKPAYASTSVTEVDSDNDDLLYEPSGGKTNNSSHRRGRKTRAEIQRAYRERKLSKMTETQMAEYRANEATRVRAKAHSMNLGQKRGPYKIKGRTRGRGKGRKSVFTPRISLKAINEKDEKVRTMKLHLDV